jgi:uncharacterized membrane protein YsdA (DUF1294 family)
MLFNAIKILLAILNVIGFALIAIDKHKAKKHMWRIPEKTFFLLALLGGCPGVYLGMMLLRHKTRHWKFLLGVPIIFLVQIILIYYFTSLR